MSYDFDDSNGSWEFDRAYERDVLREPALAKRTSTYRPCPINHEAVKADPVEFAKLTYVGEMVTHEETIDGELFPAERLQLRNCLHCGSTLAVLVKP